MLGMVMYCGDFNDALPSPGWTVNADCWITAANPPKMFAHTSANFESDYNQQVSWFTGVAATDPGSPKPPGTGLLYPYLKNPKLFLCPADVVNANYLKRPVIISSYVWNGAVQGYGNVQSPYKISKFKPTNILQWENDETQVSTGFWGDFANRPMEIAPAPSLSRRHGKAAQVGKMDGSAAREIWANIYTWCNHSPKQPNDLWYNPTSTTGE
jgi:hypothetical protein